MPKNICVAILVFAKTSLLAVTSRRRWSCFLLPTHTLNWKVVTVLSIENVVYLLELFFAIKFCRLIEPLTACIIYTKDSRARIVVSTISFVGIYLTIAFRFLQLWLLYWQICKEASFAKMFLPNALLNVLPAGFCLLVKSFFSFENNSFFHI